MAPSARGPTANLWRSLPARWSENLIRDTLVALESPPLQPEASPSQPEASPSQPEVPSCVLDRPSIAPQMHMRLAGGHSTVLEAEQHVN